MDISRKCVCVCTHVHAGVHMSIEFRGFITWSIFLSFILPWLLVSY